MINILVSIKGKSDTLVGFVLALHMLMLIYRAFKSASVVDRRINHKDMQDTEGMLGIIFLDQFGGIFLINLLQHNR